MEEIRKNQNPKMTKNKKNLSPKKKRNLLAPPQTVHRTTVTEINFYSVKILT